MSPQDTVERVLKEIHVTFSQCPTYNGEPDKIIVDRKAFLQLLDRLNQGIYDMMEKYEQTRQSRMTAERAFKKKGEEILNQANASAEDIYAASVLYTADAIGRIRELMDQTNDSMNDLFIQFRRDLRERKDVLRAHESELQAQLVDLADSKKYLSVLKDINREQDKTSLANKARREIAEFTGEQDTHIPAQAVDVKVNEEYFKKAGKAAPDTVTAGSAAEKPEIVVNQDAAYFKWKAEQEAKKKQEAADESADEIVKEAAEDERAEAADTASHSTDTADSSVTSHVTAEDPEEEIDEHERLIRQIMKEQEESGMFPKRETSVTEAVAHAEEALADLADPTKGDPFPTEDDFFAGNDAGTEFAEKSYTDVAFDGEDPDLSDARPDDWDLSDAEYDGRDLSDADDAIDGAAGEFPDEESIRQAVLEDERAYEEAHRPSKEREAPGPGRILKTLLFGKDE